MSLSKNQLVMFFYKIYILMLNKWYHKNIHANAIHNDFFFILPNLQELIHDFSYVSNNTVKYQLFAYVGKWI